MGVRAMTQGLAEVTTGAAIVPFPTVARRRAARNAENAEAASGLANRLQTLLGGIADGTDPRIAHAKELFSRAPYAWHFDVIDRSWTGAVLRVKHLAPTWRAYGLRPGTEI